MPRRKKAETPAPQPAVAKVRSIVGSNITAATLKKHHAAIQALQAKSREIAGQISAAWKAAESDGIDRKAGKLVFKLFEADPATFDAFQRAFTTYSTQLGLFDRVDDFKASEEQEANAASADVADRENARPQSGEPISGGEKEAAYAQGFEAGQGAATRSSNPYRDGEKETAWFEGFDAGRLAKVDAANSELATA